MRAAILREYGAVPEVGEHEEPSGTVGRVLAAGLNPIDLRLASGELQRPPLPMVVGKEGIAELDGRRVYFDTGGAFAERVGLDPAQVVDVPDGLAEAQAVCFGVAGLAAWIALEQRAQVRDGETVLVLGASGVVGMIAVQVARRLGAGRVVAAARNEQRLERARELGADATVRLDGSGEELTEAFREAAAGDLHVVFDPLWGAPAAAAVEALAFRGRLVQLGQSAGAEAVLRSAAIRFRELTITGHTNFASPFAERRAALERMFALAAAGELVADFEALPLERVGDAWRRQAQSPNVKLVLRP